MIASEGQAAGHGCQVPVPRCRSQARDQSREAEAKRKGSQVVGGCLAYTVCVRCRCIGASARSRAPRTASRRYSFFVQHRYGMPRGASLRASALRCNGFTPSLHLDLNMDRSGVSLLRSSARHVQRFLARGQGVQAPGTICYRVGVRCAMAAVASRSIL